MSVCKCVTVCVCGMTREPVVSHVMTLITSFSAHQPTLAFHPSQHHPRTNEHSIPEFDLSAI